MILLLHVANAQVTSGMKICWPCQRKNRLLLEQGISDISDPSLPWQTVLKLYWPFTKLFSRPGTGEHSTHSKGLVILHWLRLVLGEGLHLFPQWSRNQVQK
jgi:hypothetical protein